MSVRVFQCPGCWSVSLNNTDGGDYECECGERLTLIDLRQLPPKPVVTDAMVERAFDTYRLVYREALASHMTRRTGPGGLTRLPYLEAMRAALLAARDGEQ